jgi:hypothetical protein
LIFLLDLGKKIASFYEGIGYNTDSGAIGFDVDYKPQGACRGRNFASLIMLQTYSCKRRLYLR